jgi:hypothetical protein
LLERERERESISRSGFEFLLDFFGFIGFVLINDGAERSREDNYYGNRQIPATIC